MLDRVDRVIRACADVTPQEATIAFALALGRVLPISRLSSPLVQDLISIGRGAPDSLISRLLVMHVARKRKAN